MKLISFLTLSLIFVHVLVVLTHDYDYSTSRLKRAMFSRTELSNLYDKYLDKHGHCRPGHEYAARKMIFKSEIKKIISLRSNKEIKWKADITLMADMTEEEIDLMKGLHGNSSSSDMTHSELPVPDSQARLLSMPVEFDEWRANRMVSPVRWQSKSSCWANSAVVPMETQIAHLSGKLPELSVQELYDCVYPPEHDLTYGGKVTDAWNWVRQTGRLGLATQYPETHLKRRHSCKRYTGTPNGITGFKLTQWYKVRTEHDLFEHLAAVSPITVSMDTKGAGFWFKVYRGGLFTAKDCGTVPDHAMVVVGYTREAIIIKNSWGALWGDDGYAYWDRNGDRCCLLDDAFFPYMEKDSKAEVSKRA